ncbi:hypothetical protein CJ030_MR4G008904 [Morella rubra]|uniref:Transmembrane protein n=1 Tax=Morella rubra TaxID=262757 RepID=A0A6A1VSR7_9ROSI|nr:hypothetical protein CJ030_MR4G008904 [Morella rubra]
MLRSSSTSRVSEEFSSPSLLSSSDADRKLPTFDPISMVAKKERSRLRFAESSVHVIPLVLLLCVIVLWFFSHPCTLTTVDSLQTHWVAPPSWRRRPAVKADLALTSIGGLPTDERGRVVVL